MRVATIESTTLATVGYDEAQELLQLEFGSRVEFGNRVVYLYFGVPAAVFKALLDAPSKGRHFNGAIGCGFHAGQTPRDRLQQAVDVLPVRG